jgi:hypothetical protein
MIPLSYTIRSLPFELSRNKIYETGNKNYHLILSKTFTPTVHSVWRSLATRIYIDILAIKYKENK